MPGGRLALAMRFGHIDALVVRGRAPALSCLAVGIRQFELRNVHYMVGMDVMTTGKTLRKMFPGGAGHRSIMRIGPAGEHLSGYACINVDTYRHFGRLGAGGVMGSKNLKGIVVDGGSSFPVPEGKAYPDLFKEIYQGVTATDMMLKYHNLGTAENLSVLNTIKALPLAQPPGHLGCGHRRGHGRALRQGPAPAQDRLLRLPGGLHPRGASARACSPSPTTTSTARCPTTTSPSSRPAPCWA